MLIDCFKKLLTPRSDYSDGEPLIEQLRIFRDNVGVDAKLIVYGHSMGTGVAPRAVNEMNKKGAAAAVDGLILDSPFLLSEMIDESSYLFAAADYLLDIKGMMNSIDVHFETPKVKNILHVGNLGKTSQSFAFQWVSSLDIPVRIFHAVVDQVAPLQGAKKLLEKVKNSGKDDIDIVVWEEEGLGHIGISKTESFPMEIKRFADSVQPRRKVP